MVGPLPSLRLRHRVIGIVLACAAGACANPAAALGFGRTASGSALGQPLDFTAAVRLAPDETLDRGCVSATVRAGESTLGPGQIGVRLRAGRDAGERLVQVTTLRSLDEPVVTIEIALGCTTRIVRSFVALLDPPQTQLARVAEPPDSNGAAGSAPAPVPASAAQPSGPVPRRSAARAERRVVATATPHAGRSVRAGGGASSTGGARLRLDAPTVLAHAGESASTTASLAPSAASIAVAPMVAAQASAASAVDAEQARLAGELAQARARLQELEAGVARLEGEDRALRRSVSELQARQNVATAGAGADRLVLLLGAACVLLIGVVAGLSTRRGRVVRRWRQPAQAAPAAETATVPAEPRTTSLEDAPADVPFTYERPVLQAQPVSPPAIPITSFGGVEVTTVIDNAWFARMAAGEGESTASDGNGAGEDDTGVDLLLPLGDEHPAPSEVAPTGFRLSRFGATDVPLRPGPGVDVPSPDPLDSRPSKLRQAV
ncbi:MAG TPA: hypothetical protein VMU47_25555 [Caldimonas sp.]|nr:hypothetical protein [Caldimonas sp.]